MTRNKNLWIIIGSVIFIAALISGFVLMQPSAQDILVTSLENTKSITDGHAVVSIQVDTMDKDASGILEVWAYRTEDGPGGFRAEVLESSEEKAQGAVILSDGDTLWAYSPNENKVFIGTPQEAKTLMDENGYFSDKFGDFPYPYEGQSKDGEGEHPENAEQAIQKLGEYFNISKSSMEKIAGENTDQLKLEPIPDQMPGEYLAVGGFINLWIGQDSSMPLAFEFTGSSLGDGSITIVEYELNTGVDETLFTFEVPEGAEVVTFADLEPQSLTLEEAGETAEFDFLTPSETPPGATLVDIIEVQGSYVQRYTLPEGGSFTIAQGNNLDKSSTSESKPDDSQAVEVRGTTGQLFESEDGTKVLLTWAEGQLFYAVSGAITAEQAIVIAESLQ